MSNPSGICNKAVKGTKIMTGVPASSKIRAGVDKRTVKGKGK